MDSMMGGMMAVGWLAIVIVVLLLIGAIVALIRLLSPDISRADGGLNILLIVFAAIGVLALLGALGVLFMHWGMRGMMG